MAGSMPRITGGMFICEQFSVDHLQLAQGFGPNTDQYLLKPNDLPEVFQSPRILYYEDTVVEFDEGLHKGVAAIIRLIAQKPAE